MINTRDVDREPSETPNLSTDEADVKLRAASGIDDADDLATLKTIKPQRQPTNRGAPPRRRQLLLPVPEPG